MQVYAQQLVSQMLGGLSNEQLGNAAEQADNNAPQAAKQNAGTHNGAASNAAVQLDAERLKLIDEISRLILELKNKFPELTQNLEKARENFSANAVLSSANSAENTQVKNLTNLLNEIQKNLNAFLQTQTSQTSTMSVNSDLTQKLSNLVDEVIKLLQPPQNSLEVPQENKLLTALSKNDFQTAAAIIKDFIDVAQTAKNNSANIATFQTLLNAMQELKELGIPAELKNTPLKEFENFLLQKTGIEVPANLEKTALNMFSEKPSFASVNLQGLSLEIAGQARNNQSSESALSIAVLLKENSSFLGFFGGASSLRNSETAVAMAAAVQNSFADLSGNVKPQTEIAFSLHQIIPASSSANAATSEGFQAQGNSQTLTLLQAWFASAQIPKEEQNFWLKTELPLTPQTIGIRESILSFGVSKNFFANAETQGKNVQTVRNFSESLHALSLQSENGIATKEQANLLWRISNIEQGEMSSQKSSQQIISTLLKYQPIGNLEGELFKNLPEAVKREILSELPNGKALQPETLQKAVEKVLEKHLELQNFSAQQEHSARLNSHDEIRQTLQNLKEQIQWMRIDQDTRPQNDRENVFYFMHEGELQKGRLKVKDDRKGGSKKQSGSSVSFSIETKAKNLGQVHADLTLTKNSLNIHLTDEFGGASDAVKNERETLARELADIGITLGELIYGKTPKAINLSQLSSSSNDKKGSRGLDVRA